MRWFGPPLLIWLSCYCCMSVAAGNGLLELLSNLPQCPRSCLGDGVSNCDSRNATCVCADESFLTAVKLCISQKCTIKEALTTQNATNAYCGVAVRDRTQLMINVTIILSILSGFFILLRLGSRLFVTDSNFGLDDTFILLTLLCAIPATAINIHGTASHGEGKDIWTLNFGDITQFGVYFYILNVLYFAQVSLLKMSLLFLYLRIFQGPMQKLLWCTVTLNALFGILFIFLAIFQCSPISYSWTGWDGEHEGSCLNMNAIAWANAVISIALDVWMLVIPLQRLWSLNMHWKKKSGVTAMFIVGAFVMVVSIIRLQYLVNLGSSKSRTYDHTDISIWSTVEIHVGIVCASMPAVRMLLVRLSPVFSDSSYDLNDYQSNGDIYGRKSRTISRAHALVELPSRGESIPRPEHGGIELKRTFDVQYRDGDERRLVGLSEFENKGHGGSIGRGTSEESL
ncbi:hypothetical protein EDB80DRAFT_638131 [Ilyonectria destructans]|nr:hypothetical protein EDB80DRAFT_638131 [Ilyonectria destructans]